MRVRIAAVSLLMVMLGSTAGHAAAASGSYQGASIVQIGTTFSGTFRAGQGEAAFTAGQVDFVPNQIRITDDAGPGVFFKVCQPTGSTECGGASGDGLTGCSTTGWVPIYGFQANRALSVLVGVSDDADCLGVPTQGTVEIRHT
ncbi:MAG TPA: hypothetical protein VGB83_04735 [Actinomycetota bacterium]